MTDDSGIPGVMELQHGRRVPFSMLPTWVLHLDGLSHLGLRVYCLLLSHVNASRADGVAWPTQENLAAMAGVHRNSIGKVINDELMPLNLVEVRKHRYGDNNTRERNVYLVHELPPPAHEGVLSTADWYVKNGTPDANPQVSPDALCSVRPDALSGVHPGAQPGVQEVEEARTKRNPPPPPPSGGSLGREDDEDQAKPPAGLKDEPIEITSDDLLMANRLFGAVPWPPKIAIGTKVRLRMLNRLSVMAAKGWTEEMVRDYVADRIPDWSAARQPASLVASVLEDSPLHASEAFTAPVEAQDDAELKDLQAQVSRLEVQYAQQKEFIADCIECDNLGYLMPAGMASIEWHGHGKLGLGNDMRKVQSEIARIKEERSGGENTWNAAS